MYFSRKFVVFCTCVLPLAFRLGSTEAASGTDEQERGRRLFHGMEALQSRIVGHSSYLPATFTVCATCHAKRESPQSGKPLEARAAPLVERGMLAKIKSRRGGPPVAYTRDSFCRTLRTGIDPQYVVLTRTMPRFEVDEAQCDALWIYLKDDGANDGTR